MVSKTHYLELYINDQLVELFSQESLNLRINNVVYNPTKVAASSGEYSFSFKLPSTPTNDKIFDYANNLSKINKFRARYSAKLYSDSVLIFDGSLVCRKFDAKEKAYECNLVNIKINTLDELFGEETLADMKWEVPYNVGETINAVNADKNSKYYFPLVSYGAFQKQGVLPDGGDEDTPVEDLIYTSKYQIDPTNIFSKDSFYPSLNVLETVRKCFENKGYTVAGNAFLDSTLSNIYASTHLAEGQTCDYNAGNPKIGHCHIFILHQDKNSEAYLPTDGYNYQELKYKYEYVGDEDINNGKFNFTDILYTNMFAPSTVQLNYRSFDARDSMFHSNEGYIQIPASGFYKIKISGSTELTDLGSFNENRWVRDGDWQLVTVGDLSAPFRHDVTHERNIYTTCPIEIQLVKNYDENIELIKGPYNMGYVVGYDINVNQEYAYKYFEDGEAYNNRIQRWSAYPHERLGKKYSSRNGFGVNDHYFYITDFSKISDTSYNLSEDYGLVPIRFAETALDSNGVKMAYDPAVSDAFICGISTMGFVDRRSYGDNEGLGGTIAYRKDGYSWSKMYTAKNDALYNMGLNRYDWHTQYNIIKEIDTSTQGWQRPSMIFTTSRNANMMPIANGTTLNEYINITKNSNQQKANFQLGCIMYLEKDDILNLMLIKRCQWNSEDEMISYRVNANVDFDIMAATPKDIETIRREYYAFGSPTEFPTNLNLFNFTSKEVKVADWLKQIADAFNLTYEFHSNSVDVMTNKPLVSLDSVPINIDDRVSSDEAESEYISYPREMSVRYKIDTEEHGFYKSVPSEFINRSDWKDHGDSGYTIIKLDDDTYNTEVQTKNLQFSYNWNDNFTWVSDSGDTPTISGTCNIPVISKEEYMIDGYQDWESMKHRGYSLAQRFWFRGFEPLKVSNNDIMPVEIVDDGHVLGSTVVTGYSVNVYAPLTNYQGVDLSYKDDRSILTNYFNITPNLSSNYVYVECYLTPEEYLSLKNGNQVKFDDDVYLVSEISGYDPSGSNKTKLKLLKKT